MARLPELISALDKIKSIHISKNEDYAQEANPMSNFDVQEYFASQFKNDRDKVFATMLGVKFARLANLMSKNGEPNNESIEDTFIDFATYVLLFYSDYVRRKTKDRLSNTRINEANTV